MNSQEGIILSPTPAKHTSGAVPIFNDPNVMLVAAVVPVHAGSPRQFILCWDTSAQRHSLYQCVVLNRPSEHDSQRNAASVMQTDTLSARRTSASDTEHLSASRPRLSRQASMSVHRRSSAAVSTAAAMASVSRRKSGYGSAAKNDRRSSLLGRVSFNDSPGIGYAADMFSEQRQMRAEVVLHMRWKDKRPKEAADRTGSPPDADVCVVQTASGKDLVCILNKDTRQIIGIDALAFTEVFRCPAQSMAPVRASRRSLDDLIVVDPSGHIALVAIGGDSAKGDEVVGTGTYHGCEPIRLNTVHQGHVVEIVGSEGGILSVAIDNSVSCVSVSAQVQMSRLAVGVLHALSLVLSNVSYFLLWRSVVASLVNTADALSEIDRIALLLLSGSDQGLPTPVILALRARNEIQDRSAAVLFVLQLVYEDAALYSSEPQPRLSVLGRLLFHLTHRAGFVNASFLYLGYRLCPDGSSGLEYSSDPSHQQRSSHCRPPIVPSLAKWAISAFNSRNARLTAFPALSDAREIFDIADSEPVYGAHTSLVLLDTLSNVIYNLASGHDPMRIAQHLAAAENPELLLSQMRPELQWVICSAMLRLRDLGTAKWPEDVLRFLGRIDLIANSSASATGIGCALGGRYTFGGDAASNTSSLAVADGIYGQPTESNSIVDLCGQIRDMATSTSKNPSMETRRSAEYREIGQSVFNSDLRVEEVERLLDDNAATYTTGSLVAAESVEDLDEAKTRYMDLLARRVFALPLGQSLLRYSTCNLNSQDSLTASPPRVKA
ncbi:hypothetical protein LPJ81_005183, partial [Coemansia sp. IMI 209127]